MGVQNAESLELRTLNVQLRELVLEGWLMTSAPSAACQLPSAAGDTVLAAGTSQIDINSGVQ